MSPAVVTTWIPDEILLVIIFSFEPLRSGRDLSHDLLSLGVEMILLDLLCDLSGNASLLIVRGEDGGAILSSMIVSLSVDGGRVMGAIEELNKFSIVDDIRIELDPTSFRMPGPPTADFLVVRLGHLSASNEPNTSLQDSLILLDRIMLQENMFRSPETSVGEDRHFRGSTCGGHGLNSGVLETNFTRGTERCSREEYVA